MISKLRADRPDTCRAAGIPAERVNKIFQGRPHILDLVANEGIQLIVDTPGGSSLPHNGNVVRRSAIRARIPYVTTLAAARAAMEGIRHMQDQRGAELKSLQEWHREIRAGE